MEYELEKRQCPCGRADHWFKVLKSSKQVYFAQECEATRPNNVSATYAAWAMQRLELIQEVQRNAAISTAALAELMRTNRYRIIAMMNEGRIEPVSRKVSPVMWDLDSIKVQLRAWVDANRRRAQRESAGD